MSELIEVKREVALDVFKADKGLDPYLNKIRGEIDSFTPSVETKKERDEIASMAHKIARSKTYLDGIGKELVAELKEIPKKIDAERKRMRDTLDEWKVEVRMPLTAWEEEQAAIKLKEEIEAAHEEAIKLNELFDREKEIERKEAEQRAKAEAERLARERAEREEALKREAAEKARVEAEQKAAKEKAEAEQKIAEQKLAIERAEREAKEAKEKAEAEAKAQIERERQARIAEEERLKREEEARAADKAHRARVNNSVLAAFSASGLSEDQGKSLIKLMAKGEIPNATINY